MLFFKRSKHHRKALSMRGTGTVERRIDAVGGDMDGDIASMDELKGMPLGHTAHAPQTSSL
jgi:hypothetical protein